MKVTSMCSDHTSFYSRLNTKIPFPRSLGFPKINLISDQVIKSIKHRIELVIQYWFHKLRRNKSIQITSWVQIAILEREKKKNLVHDEINENQTQECQYHY